METVSAPSFNPPGGTFASTVNVIITSATPGATIHFTTDGREPTESGPSSNQLAAVDSVLLLEGPFLVVNSANRLNGANDPNTRVTIFVMALQLFPGETASSVVVNLTDASGQSYDIAAEDVRLVPNFNFTQVIFRLPSGLAVGTCQLNHSGQ